MLSDGAVRERVGSLGDLRGGEPADCETDVPRMSGGGVGFSFFGRGGGGGGGGGEEGDTGKETPPGEGGGRGFSKRVSSDGGRAPVLRVVLREYRDEADEREDDEERDEELDELEKERRGMLLELCGLPGDVTGEPFEGKRIKDPFD